MLNDVADGADGNARLARTDGHTAAVGVRDGHHALDVRIFRQQLPPDTLRDAPDDARRALHRRDDAEIVARSGRAGGIAVAHPCPDGRLRQLLGWDQMRAPRQPLQRRAVRHMQHILPHPASLRDLLHRVTQHHAVADDGCACGDGLHRRLVGLRQILQQPHAAGKHRPLFQRLYRDGHIVLRMDLKNEPLCLCLSAHGHSSCTRGSVAPPNGIAKTEASAPSFFCASASASWTVGTGVMKKARTVSGSICETR